MVNINENREIARAQADGERAEELRALKDSAIRIVNVNLKGMLRIDSQEGGYADGSICIDGSSLCCSVLDALSVKYEPDAEIGPCEVKIEIHVINELPYPIEDST